MPEIFRLEISSNYSTKLMNYAMRTNYQSRTTTTLTTSTYTNSSKNNDNRTTAYNDNNNNDNNNDIGLESICPYLSSQHHHHQESELYCHHPSEESGSMPSTPGDHQPHLSYHHHYLSSSILSLSISYLLSPPSSSY